MIHSIRLENYQDSVECTAPLYSSVESFVCLTYEFRAGQSYGIISDYGCGSWACAMSVCGNTSGDYKGSIYIDGQRANPSELENRSCMINAESYPELTKHQLTMMTVKEILDYYLKKTRCPYSVERIIAEFGLSNERVNRTIDCISGEIWLASAAIGFASGKQIFAYPWLNEREVFRYVVAEKMGVINFLKSHGCIILVPSSQKAPIRRLCDHIIVMNRGKHSFD